SARWYPRAVRLARARLPQTHLQKCACARVRRRHGLCKVSARTSMRRPLSIALTVNAVLLLVVALSAHLTLTSTRGREWLRERICRTVSDSIQGSLEIDEIAAIELPRVKARGVRIVAPDGVPAIDVASADIFF